MENNKVYAKVFLWMFVGLLISFLTGIYVSTQEAMLVNLYKNGIIWWILIAELVLVLVLSWGIKKMNPGVAKVLFCLYALATGFSLSSLFLVYEVESLILVFVETSVVFGLFAFIGLHTKKDLTKFGTIFLMGLIGILIAAVVNIFLGNEIFDIVINAIGILLFLGVTAYDMQKVKLLAETEENEDRVAIYGALELYLDFINIFIKLLQLFGKEKD